MVMKIVALFKQNYGLYENATEEDMQTIIDSWYWALKDYDGVLVKEALKKVLITCKHKPTIAHIVEQINQIEQANNKSDQELWDELDKQSLNACHYIGCFKDTYIPIGETKTQGDLAREKFGGIFDRLDPLIKEYLGNSKKRFYDIALMKQDEINFEMTRFFKAMPSIRERVKTKQELATNNLLVEKNIKKIEKN